MQQLEAGGGGSSWGGCTWGLGGYDKHRVSTRKHRVSTHEHGVNMCVHVSARVNTTAGMSLGSPVLCITFLCPVLLQEARTGREQARGSAQMTSGGSGLWRVTSGGVPRPPRVASSLLGASRMRRRPSCSARWVLGSLSQRRKSSSTFRFRTGCSGGMTGGSARGRTGRATNTRTGKADGREQR